MGVGNFPVDLVLLGMIAAFLVLRLRSVLGKRTGFERAAAAAPRSAPSGRTIDVKAEPAPDRVPPVSRVLPERDSVTGVALARIEAADSSFTPTRFLDGAEGAFRLIVLAFARGDRDALRPLLSSAMIAAFEGAIAERDAAGHVQHTTLHSIHSAIIASAVLEGMRADIAVRFVSDQISYSTDVAEKVLTGTDAVTEITRFVDVRA